jgi:hypothetical protein
MCTCVEAVHHDGDVGEDNSSHHEGQKRGREGGNIPISL